MSDFDDSWDWREDQEIRPRTKQFETASSIGDYRRKYAQPPVKESKKRCRKCETPIPNRKQFCNDCYLDKLAEGSRKYRQRRKAARQKNSLLTEL